MTQSLALESRPLALELHQLLRDIDPSRWRDDVEAAVRQRAAALEAAIARLLARVDENGVVAARLHELAQVLRDRLPSLPSAPSLPASPELRAAWDRYRKELQQSYEALRTTLRDWRVDLPSVRPTNYTRSTFHALISITAIVLVEEVLSASLRWIIPLAVACTFWFLETLRHKNERARAFLLWLFRRIAHPYERYRINSATWYVSGLTVLALLCDPIVCSVAVAVLGIGDPVAALVGRRWGRTPIAAQRSLEGSLAFLVAAFGAAFVVLTLWHGDVALGARLLIALSAALAGAIMELVSHSRLDDNFTVPLAAAAGGWGALALLS
jgi:dolichol kinase